MRGRSECECRRAENGAPTAANTGRGGERWGVGEAGMQEMTSWQRRQQQTSVALQCSHSTHHSPGALLGVHRSVPVDEPMSPSLLTVTAADDGKGREEKGRE